MPVKVQTDVEWHGDEAIVAGFSMTGRSVWEIGLVVEGQWKLLAPIDTGRYAGSITVQMKNKGTGFTVEGRTAPEPGDKVASPTKEQQAYVGTNVFYAPYSEYGTFKAAAQPAMRPTMALVRGKSVTIVRKNGRQEFKEFS